MRAESKHQHQQPQCYAKTLTAGQPLLGTKPTSPPSLPPSLSGHPWSYALARPCQSEPGAHIIPPEEPQRHPNHSTTTSKRRCGLHAASPASKPHHYHHPPRQHTCLSPSMLRLANRSSQRNVRRQLPGCLALVVALHCSRCSVSLSLSPLVLVMIHQRQLHDCLWSK